MADKAAGRIGSLGFIGAGNMATAILRGVAGNGMVPAGACAAYDVMPEKPKELAKELGIVAAGSLEELAAKCGAIVLATKPQDLMPVLEKLSAVITAKHLIISIAAGVRSAKIESKLPAETRVVRVMPNTPALVGEGAAGVAAGTHASAEDVDAVCKLFGAVGISVKVKEEDLDAVTALSGSGPAYVFRFMEIMQAAAAEMGIAPEVAKQLTLQTFLGASKLAIGSEDSPAELRKKVTSKGGTTAAALEVMEQKGLESLLKDALRAARDRSIELSK